MTPTYASYNEFKTQLLAAFQSNEDRMNGESKTPLHQVRRAALQQFDLLGFVSITVKLTLRLERFSRPLQPAHEPKRC